MLSFRVVSECGQCVFWQANGYHLALSSLLTLWIQNVADSRRNGRIGKVFELVELRFHCNIEYNFRIRTIFLYRDRNRNRNQNCILNP